MFTSNEVHFQPLPDNLIFLASDHYILAAAVAAQRPNSHAYTVTNCEAFERPSEDPPPYQHTTFSQAYKDLKTLLSRNLTYKRGSNHSKRWRDQEIDAQLYKGRRAKAPEDHKAQKKALTKLIKQKKRVCWVKFFEENGRRDP